jgi:tetratricopeptide (TPR) repeat protein
MGILNRIFRRRKGSNLNYSHTQQISDEVESTDTNAVSFDIASLSLEELNELENPDSAIEPLMRELRRDPSNYPPVLCGFFGKIENEKSIRALEEIIDLFRSVDNRFAINNWIPLACLNLLQLAQKSSRLKEQISTEESFLFANALIADNECHNLFHNFSSRPIEKTAILMRILERYHMAKDKSEVVDTICSAMVALGVEEAITPLLEIFREAKPSTIREDGSIHTKGTDGAVASALVAINGGIEKLNSICSSDEFERILICAFEYSWKLTPSMIKYFEELGTSRTIGRLIHVSLKTGFRNEELERSAKEALIRIREKANPLLLKMLKIEVPTNRKYQTEFRKKILNLLGQSGDELCVQDIVAITETDMTVIEEAKDALAGISNRCKGVAIPSIIIPEPKQIKRIPSTGDHYIDDCFRIDFSEHYDERDYSEIPEAKAITHETMEDAIRLANALREKYPDFYFSYFWLGILYQRKGLNEEARKFLFEGLDKSKSKFSICEKLGDIEFKSENLPEAVKWWIKSVIIQVCTNNLDNYSSFLNLSYIAEQFELMDTTSKLRQFVDAIEVGQIRLNSKASNEIYAITRAQGTKSMRQAIDILNKEYLSTYL